METERCALWSSEELMTHNCVHLHITFLAKKSIHGNLEKLTYRDYLLCQGSEKTLFYYPGESSFFLGPVKRLL